jgi:hypothetical protein
MVRGTERLSETHRARRTAAQAIPLKSPSKAILIDYVKEREPGVASSATLAGSVKPLTAFFENDTIADRDRNPRHGPPTAKAAIPPRRALGLAMPVRLNGRSAQPDMTAGPSA